MEELDKIKKNIEDNLCKLVSYVNRDYAKPLKEDLLNLIDIKLKGYIANSDNKELTSLILLNEFLSGIMIGFRR